MTTGRETESASLDEDIFADAMSDNDLDQEVQDDDGSQEPGHEEEQAENRDPTTGRFTSKAKAEEGQTDAESEDEADEDDQPEVESEPEAQPEQTAQKGSDGHFIPLPVHLELREKRQEAERIALERERERDEYKRQMETMQRQFQALQQQIHQAQQRPQEPIDPYENPEAWQQQFVEREQAREQQYQRQINQLRLETNFSLAQSRHGETFDESMRAFMERKNAGDVAVVQRVMSSSNPGEAVVAWFKETKTLKEIGTDPDAYVQRKLEAALEDPEFLKRAFEKVQAKAKGTPAGQPASQDSRPNMKVKLPPSISRVPGATAQRQGATAPGGDPEQELFNDALYGR